MIEERSDGLSLAGYDILTPLHVGTHSRVLRAQRRADHRRVVLKTTAAVQPAATDAARITGEYALLTELSHPALVRALALEHVGDRPVLVLEDAGVSAGDRLRGSGWPIEDALALAIAVAEALDTLHRADLLHCDIHPGNLLYNEDSKTGKLADLGRAVRIARFRVRPRGHFPGDLPQAHVYSAPECSGWIPRTVDGRADLYALGVSLYVLLSGALPTGFATPAAAVEPRPRHAHPRHDTLVPEGLLRAKTAPMPPDVRVHAPHTPAAVADIVARLMARAPEDRFADGASVAAALKACTNRASASASAPRTPVAAPGGGDAGQT